jgi:hypothetical protein
MVSREHIKVVLVVEAVVVVVLVGGSDGTVEVVVVLVVGSGTSVVVLVVWTGAIVEVVVVLDVEVVVVLGLEIVTAHSSQPRSGVQPEKKMVSPSVATTGRVTSVSSDSNNPTIGIGETNAVPATVSSVRQSSVSPSAVLTANKATALVCPST